MYVFHGKDKRGGATGTSRSEKNVDSDQEQEIE